MHVKGSCYFSGLYTIFYLYCGRFVVSNERNKFEKGHTDTDAEITVRLPHQWSCIQLFQKLMLTRTVFYLREKKWKLTLCRLLLFFSEMINRTFPAKWVKFLNKDWDWVTVKLPSLKMKISKPPAKNSKFLCLEGLQMSSEWQRTTNLWRLLCAFIA